MKQIGLFIQNRILGMKWPDAVRLMKAQYGIDMEKDPYPKLLEDLGMVDIVITMRCNVACVNLPCTDRMDWNPEDPTGKSDEEFMKVIDSIEKNRNTYFGKELTAFQLRPPDSWHFLIKGSAFF